MPSAAKLFAALSLAVLAWAASDMVRGLVPYSVDYGYFNFVNAFIGVLLGWLFLGARAGDGFVSAINNGVTSAVMMVVVGVLVQGTNEMVRLSFARRYDSPFEAVAAIFQISIDYFVILGDVNFWITALVGGVLAGLVTEAVGKSWR